MTLSIEQLLSEKFINGIVEKMSGEDGICKEKEDEDCSKKIAEFIPIALPAIASTFDEKTDVPPVCNQVRPDTCKP